jgi:hypothetical protein
MKYKTQKEEKAYLRGYDDGAREQAQVLEDALDNAHQVISWRKWEQFDFDWSMVALVVVMLLVVVSMITYQPNF